MDLRHGANAIKPVEGLSDHDSINRVVRERDPLRGAVEGFDLGQRRREPCPHLGDRLDRDQLDERARQLLNLVDKNEIVVPYESDRRLF